MPGLGVEATADDVGLERIGPDNEVRDAGDQRTGHVGLPGPHDRRLADPRDALVGVDLDEHGLQGGRAMAAAPPARPVGAPLGDGDDGLADLRDLHARLRKRRGSADATSARPAATSSAEVAVDGQREVGDARRRAGRRRPRARARRARAACAASRPARPRRAARAGRSPRGWCRGTSRPSRRGGSARGPSRACARAAPARARSSRDRPPAARTSERS